MASGDWFTLYDTATGALRGHTSEAGLPSPIPAGITVVEHGPARQDQGNRWNATTRTWVAIPAEVLVDRLADLAGHAYLANVWSRLTAAQRTQLRKAMVWLLGGKRYRQPTEEVALDVDPSWPTDPATVTE
jgi:hypothetical protein